MVGSITIIVYTIIVCTSANEQHAHDIGFVVLFSDARVSAKIGKKSNFGIIRHTICLNASGSKEKVNIFGKIFEQSGISYMALFFYSRADCSPMLLIC